VELQSRYDDITRQGLGVIALSYDSPEMLRRFTASRNISFPLVSDPGSAIIKQYGLLNETVDPKSSTYGIPHPGTFIVDRTGVVVSRFFEDAYQERYTTAAILSSLGAGIGGGTVTADTAHLTLTATISDTTAAPGERLSIVVDASPKRGMHLYAPGTHTYRVVQVTIDPHPWLRTHETVYPASQIYHFKPLDERVEVFIQPFRLRRDLTLLATQAAQKALAAMPSLTITGALAYQACDDRLCFNPARVPFSFEIALKALDRRPAGGR